MVLFDANTLMLLLDPALPAPKDKSTGEPVTEVEKRIKHLVDTLQKRREKIVIPTPALAEVLTKADRAGADYFIKIDRSAAFRIEAFGSRAAIELARMTTSAINAGDKRGGVSASWNKIKFDRQIVAIAKIKNVSMIYSDDLDLAQFSTAQGISVTTVSQLPLPPPEEQMGFAWNMVHEDDDTEDEGEFKPEEP